MTGVGYRYLAKVARDLAEELCDGKDNDCDKQIDEGLTGEYYPDEDGDGYGGGRFTTTACEAPSGYVDNTDDCDDLDPLVFPDQAEDPLPQLPGELGLPPEHPHPLQREGHQQEFSLGSQRTGRDDGRATVGYP